MPVLKQPGAIKKIDKLGVTLLTTLIALAVGTVYAALHFGWFESPLQLAGWLVVGLAFVIAGLGVHTHQIPRNANVHGAARPASESEAQASARGEAKSPSLHDRTFSD
jgi:hypothetical protein